MKIFLFLAALPVFAAPRTIELVVEKSIELHFRDYRQNVDLLSLEIRSERNEGGTLVVHSAVKAFAKDYRDWYWYACETKLTVQGELISDHGTRCELEVE